MIQDAGLRDTMAFIERESIYGMGCGLIDIILWTLDKRLADLATRFGVAYLDLAQYK